MENITKENGHYQVNCTILAYRQAIQGMLASAIINIIISIPVIVLNSLVITVILRNKKLQKPSYYLLLNTAICDLLIGAVSIPVWSSNLFMIYNRGTHDCLLITIKIGLSHLFGTMSFLAVFLSALDRYVAIFKPYFYEEKIRFKSRIYLNISISLWVVLVGLILTALFIQSLNLIFYIQIFASIMATSCSFYIHIKIYQTVKVVHTRIRSQTFTSDTTVQEDRIQEDRIQEDRIREDRVALLTFLMLLALVIFYLSYTVMMIAWLINRELISSSITTWNFTIVSLKSLVNPLLYGFTMKDIRAQSIKLFCRITRHEVELETNTHGITRHEVESATNTQHGLLTRKL